MHKKQVWLIVTSITFTLLILESICMFMPRSHGVGGTLANWLWFKKYWNPVNSHHYRDIEVADSYDKTKQTLVIIGDSFVSGHGVKYVKDRFSNILKEQFKAKLNVYNLGINGADTRVEYDNLIKFPVPIDYIILSYFGNDIEGVGRENGMPIFDPPGYYSETNIVFKFFIKQSYLINYLYWSWPRAYLSNYNSLLKEAYSNPTILKNHFDDLKKFITFSKVKHAKLVVVIFPDMYNPSESDYYIKPISEYFKTHNIFVMDVRNLLAGKNPKELYVNSNDGHPNEKVNSILANGLIPVVSNLISARENK